MLIMASATTVVLMMLRVNYYYLLGPLAGLAILVPYVGVLFSTIPAVAVAYFQYDMSKALIVLVVYTGAPVPGGERPDALHRRGQGEVCSR